MFREILQKAIVGFFFGFGASIAAFAMIFFYESNRPLVKGWFGPDYVHYSGSEIPGLKITAHKQRTDSEKYTVVGTVTNLGDIPLKDISIKVQIIDGEFVLGQCFDGVDRGQYLNKNEIGYFSVECDALKTADNKYPYKVSLSRAVAYEQ